MDSKQFMHAVKIIHNMTYENFISVMGGFESEYLHAKWGEKNKNVFLFLCNLDEKMQDKFFNFAFVTGIDDDDS